MFVGATGNSVKEAIKRELKADFPQIEALTNQEFIDDQAGQIDQVLALIYALLALAIIVSLFGIVNTLVLSITERTRELGMLRAIGTSRRQVRKMIRYEAIITAMLGGDPRRRRWACCSRWSSAGRSRTSSCRSRSAA